ncbi:ribbon-helix-helix domain-containing protein [Alteromonas sediminis]|uniref:Ribbon-helix-helix domain-containing protein n=1 Tax=Alteromonas sediminis TaxID=2259342 RepID=A0A3N5Y3S6_9ALTE|nr:ribbon-helix-helix domain-containing protein [Alteromonas sediminis]RPJ68010.1 ribbon-helix-helix domain-containing protein [Alteromonas sediminis]
MSLTDLKKKQGSKQKPKLSVDEFINDAEAYARGKSVIESAQQESHGHHRNFKLATFTLSPSSIEQLNVLAKKSGIAKSRLIRIMIEKYFHEEMSKPFDADI